MELKKYRAQAEMTQAEIAFMLGIPRKTYQNYELETREPTTDILCELADYYGVTLDELVGRPAPQERVPKRAVSYEDGLTRLGALYSSMSRDARKSLLVIAEELASTFPEKEVAE